MYRIIVISDSEIFLRNAQTFLPKYITDMRIVPLSDPAGIDGILAEKDVDAYIVDNDPPIIDAIGIFNRRNAKQDYRPFMITAEEFDEDTLLKSFEIGIGSCFPRRSSPAVDFLSMARKIVPLIEKHRIEIDNKNSDRRLKALVKLARMYNHSLDEIMHFSLEESISLTDSEVGYIALYDKNRDELEVKAWTLRSSDGSKVPDAPMKYSLSGSGLWGMPVRLGQSMIVNDYRSQDVFGKKGTPPGHLELKRLILIPLLCKGEAVGTACVANKHHDYTESDRDQFVLMMDGFTNVYTEKNGLRDNAHIRLEKIMEMFPFAAVVIDRKLRIREYNRSADELLGINGAESMNMDMTPLSVKLMFEITRFTMDGSSNHMHTDIEDDRGSGKMYCVEMTSAESEGDTVYLITIRRQDLEVLHGLNHECCDFYGMMDSAVTAVEKSYTDLLSSTDLLLPDRLRLDFESMMDLARIYGIHPNMKADDSQWQDVSLMIEKAIECSGIGCEIIDNVGSIFIKASPMYYRAFTVASHMLLRRGADRLRINYRIFHGTLTIHMDVGAPYNLISIDKDDDQMTSVDSACLHFIEHISQISGFVFRKEWLTSSNMRLSVDIPSELYEIH